MIGILGYGWLGKALTEKLLNEGYSVNASKTNWSKESDEYRTHFKPFKLLLTEHGIEGELAFFAGVPQLLILLPPKQKLTGFNLLTLLNSLYEFLPQTPIERIIFTSSTSVYGNQTGIINEDSPLRSDTKNAKLLVQCEKFIEQQTLPHFILRLGGLIGSDRHPIMQLQEKIIKNPAGYINFIHQSDAVNILFKAILRKEINGVYNAVCPTHPNRKDYYIAMAKRKGLPQPKFENDSPIKRRIISKKICQVLNYDFKVNNLLI